MTKQVSIAANSVNLIQVEVSDKVIVALENNNKGVKVLSLGQKEIEIELNDEQSELNVKTFFISWKKLEALVPVSSIHASVNSNCTKRYVLKIRPNKDYMYLLDKFIQRLPSKRLRKYVLQKVFKDVLNQQDKAFDLFNSINSYFREADKNSLESIENLKETIRLAINAEEISFEFFNESKNEKNISTLNLVKSSDGKACLKYPIRNTRNDVIGMIEAKGKYGANYFSDEDEQFLSVFSLVIPTMYGKYFPRKLNYKCEVSTEASQIVGLSEPIIRVREAVVKTKNINYPILVKGQRGTGKDLVIQKILNFKNLNESLILAVDCDENSERPVSDYNNYHCLYFKNVHNLSIEHQKELCERFEKCEEDFLLIVSSNKVELQKYLTKEFMELISQVEIELPALTEVKEDILRLGQYFINVECEKNALAPKEISKDLYRAFLAYSWPGNIKELERCCKRLVQFYPGYIVLDKVSNKNLHLVENQEELMEFYEQLFIQEKISA